ncbi:uracil-DNA glycosylase-like isoform X1 [Haliotis rubra]|uniref:uracil-DNA glycosylase-like isoform X1 n=2 Tax=Haliotis rubra TaxID=36100 RepID=UPI001EE50AFC|nr:uracil-DNA glycosylase-like isoform X1 [Haliotis rubra]
MDARTLSEFHSPVKVAEAKASMSSSFDLKSLLTESSWTEALQEVFQEQYFEDLQKQLEKDYSGTKQIFPPKEKIFNAFNLTPIDKVRVVILGQDPYHGDGQAEGLAFSMPDGLAVPPSLKNIYKELTTDIPGFKTPAGGSLEKWAVQGVFLLNATLTVEARKPDSHKGYDWQKLTDQVIKIISDHCPFVVFNLWGNIAQEKVKQIDDKKHTIIKNAHPSPLSFTRFAGCKCFSATNDALQKKGFSPINWSLE